MITHFESGSFRVNSFLLLPDLTLPAKAAGAGLPFKKNLYSILPVAVSNLAHMTHHRTCLIKINAPDWHNLSAGLTSRRTKSASIVVYSACNQPRKGKKSHETNINAKQLTSKAASFSIRACLPRLLASRGLVRHQARLSTHLLNGERVASPVPSFYNTFQVREERPRP